MGPRIKCWTRGEPATRNRQVSAEPHRLGQAVRDSGVQVIACEEAANVLSPKQGPDVVVLATDARPRVLLVVVRRHARERVDPKKLLHERATRMEHAHGERCEVRELADIDGGAELPREK